MVAQIVVIGDKKMCVLASELYGAEIVEFSDFERVRAAKRILLMNVSVEDFRAEYPDVFLDSYIVAVQANNKEELLAYDDLITAKECLPRPQFKEHIVNLVYGPESSFSEKIVYSHSQSKYVRAEEYRRMPEKIVPTMVLDETITENTQAKNWYVQLEGREGKYTFIVSEKNIEEYEKYFGIAIPIKE